MCVAEAVDDHCGGERLATAFSGWYARARAAWHSLDGSAPHRAAEKFRWEPVTGKLACRNAGATGTSACLRGMAQRVVEIGALMRKGATVEHPQVAAHLLKLTAAMGSGPLKGDAINRAGLEAWCCTLRAVLAAGEVDKALALNNVLVAKALGIERAEGRARSRAWRDALAGVAPTGRQSHGRSLSRLAYRWVRGIGGWSRSTVGTEAEEDLVPEGEPGGGPYDDHVEVARAAAPAEAPSPSVPRSDQAEVNATAVVWAELWQTDAPYPDIDFGDVGAESLPALSVAVLREAAASFPVHTGLGADNIAPRALLRLPDAALQELADLLSAAERIGSWTAAFRLVLIVLIPKVDGGDRPIGLFPTVIRLWMRARAVLARKWEEETAMPELYGGRGMGAQRAAWLAAFSAEAAAASGADHAAALLDLVKAFEMIPHRLLVRAARKHGFSLKVLRLSLAAYRIARTIGVDGVFSDCLRATRGITAGSGFATTELRSSSRTWCAASRCSGPSH